MRSCMTAERGLEMKEKKTQNFICTTDFPVAETVQGKIRGFQTNGIYTFHGIRYAEARRFHRPEPVKPWEGIRDALSYGFVCPLLNQDTPTGEVLIPHRYWPMDENCQYLNIWTGSLDPKAKKPVMVWLHGGGFYAGSSIEQEAYDGENMSRYGDVVVVSLNHRLNILGYLDLSPFGEEYKNSANAGNDDMIAALKWIQENIRNFGGDPENVTLFGQSGGGMKVWNLMQMPEADGLFHKGIVQSGVMDGFLDPGEGDGTRIAEALLEELGFEKDQVKELETVPYRQLADAWLKVSPELKEKGYYVGSIPKPNEFYLGEPTITGFRSHAKKIPVIIGTVFGEFDFGPGFPGKYDLSQEKILEILKEKFGSSTEQLVELFKKAYPEKCLLDLLSLDNVFRTPTIEFVEERSKSPESETYSYLFAYEFPLDDGKCAWHCSEIPYVFHNADRIPICRTPGVMEKLQDAVFGAWISFAKEGKPYVPGIDWKRCGKDEEQVLVFDETCSLRKNFDHELVRLHAEATGPFIIEEAENLQH